MNDNGKGKKRSPDDELVQVKVPRRTLKMIKLIAAYREIEMGAYVAELVDRYGSTDLKSAAREILAEEKRK